MAGSAARLRAHRFYGLFAAFLFIIALGGCQLMSQMLSIQAVRGAEFPRTFTSQVSDFGDWAQLEPLYQQLEREIQAAKTPADVEAWLLRQSELDAVLGEEHSRRYIAYTCQTDDEAREKAYLHFIEDIVPRTKPWDDKLARLYLACPARAQADRQRLEVHDRVLENQVALFREENVPLQTEDSKLGQQYQKINGAMMVTWRGEEKTLQQMAPYQEETERAVREEAWRTVAARRRQDADKLSAIFDEMIRLRTRIAKNAGFENFRDYQHRAYNRFDYAPADCEKFHQAVEQEVVPLLARLRRQRMSLLDLDALRPWDLGVDPEGAPPLKPFASAEQLETGCAEIFGRLNNTLAGQFDTMRQRGLLDLASRKGKAPGGYMSNLEEVRLPFIFMNAAGTNRDVFTLLHEGGHAFHAFACRAEPLIGYRSAPMEFSEVASMSMEMFGLTHLDVFYKNEDEARRARRRHFEDLVQILPWIATIDAFQQWLYTHPEHSAAEREAKWLELEQRFSPEVDWSGLEAEHRTSWQRQLHLFEVPFYYIEYGIAQLGAAQLWLQFRDHPHETLENYRRGLALGGSRPLPELFKAAGIRFDFSAETLRPIMKAVAEALSENEPV